MKKNQKIKTVKKLRWIETNFAKMLKLAEINIGYSFKLSICLSAQTVSIS